MHWQRSWISLWKSKFEIEIYLKRQQLRRCNCRLPMPFQCDFQSEISLLWKSSKISSFGMFPSRDGPHLSDTILASDVILFIWRVKVLGPSGPVWTCLTGLKLTELTKHSWLYFLDLYENKRQTKLLFVHSSGSFTLRNIKGEIIFQDMIQISNLCSRRCRYSLAGLKIFIWWIPIILKYHTSHDDKDMWCTNVIAVDQVHSKQLLVWLVACSGRQHLVVDSYYIRRYFKTVTKINSLIIASLI